MGIEQLEQQADIPHLQERGQITKLMYLIWKSRKDLQLAFDLETSGGQEKFIQWYEVSVLREYGLDPRVYEYSGSNDAPSAQFAIGYLSMERMTEVLSQRTRNLPRSIRVLGKFFWLRLIALSLRYQAKRSTIPNSTSVCVAPEKSIGSLGLPGANLIGYAQAELGMGEHVRMTAAALKTTSVRFGVVNFDVGIPSRKKASLDYGELTTANYYRTNIFHINADQMLKAYCHLGQKFFKDRYNIGYWAWELARCPEEWVPVIEMVDEIWAPSRFIQRAFAEKTQIPVEYMPLCVTLPPFKKRKRDYFGLPDNRFLFVFAFDFLSYIERKNPMATIRAFQSAFPDRTDKVGLVIKVMNGDANSPHWVKMMDKIADDKRINVLNQTIDRGDVLALIDACDCFVSLHRSEGFGRGPAEAMYLGKPVIVTNYSGNTDFTRSDNCCLVDYSLIPIETGQYLFEEGQVWADVDVEHAAWYMRRLVSDRAFAKEIGTLGKEFVLANFNPHVIGQRYKKRLQVLALTN